MLRHTEVVPKSPRAVRTGFGKESNFVLTSPPFSNNYINYNDLLYNNHCL